MPVRNRSVMAGVAGALLMLSSDAGAAAVGVAWDRNPEPDVVRYVLRYGTTSQNYTSTVDVGASTTWRVTGLLEGVRYYFAVQACNSFACSALSSEVYGVAEVPIPIITTDLSGDRRSDVTVWRPGTGMWFSRISDGGFLGTTQVTWGSGALGDIPVLGDYDGDGRSDPAVWRPGTGFWHIRQSTGSTFSTQWGSGSVNDIPLTADFDGDRRSDIAVWRPGTGMWFVNTSSSGFTSSFSMQWGAGSQRDVPVPADYDGDGRADLAVWRPASGTWFIKTSGTNYTQLLSISWGSGSLGDVPVPGDFDGDARADIAVWRPNTMSAVWHVRTSRSNYATATQFAWGAGSLNDQPVLGDFDGDGRADPTVWRPGSGTWFILTSSSNHQSYEMFNWGAASLNDVPIGRPRLPQ